MWEKLFWKTTNNIVAVCDIFFIIFAKRNELICMELNCAIQVDTDADFERLLSIYE